MEGSLPGAHKDALSPQHPIERCLEDLKDQVFHVLQNETSYKETIQRLETELTVYKRAFADVDTELKAARLSLLESDQHIERLENEYQSFRNQDKGHRVVMLLDGDGAIFSPQLISQGQRGGHLAAEMLSDSTSQHLIANYGPRAYQLWAYIFFNKRGLMDTFRRVGLVFLMNKFEDFVAGFNQATERFLMVDVGTAKEAADAKLKVYLEDEIRLPETFKIFFGGCHDNGYAANLHSQITAGYKEKLILLKSYTDMAASIAALELPHLLIPELFMPRKIFEQHSSPPEPEQPDVPPRPINPNLVCEAICFTTPLTFLTQTVDGKAQVAVSLKLPRELTSPSEKPGACTLFYLKSCKFGTSCKFAHDYVLTDPQREELRKFAKKAPCPAALKGATCHWGDSCCYGHTCPYSPTCFFLKQGKCKFRQASMHAAPPG
ncbi:hypothetical protein C8J57DRAFT_1196042 [Mycena rebaudengoi]|nr:hypothetical protein C8J57DRAFT_1196042 [Mycena rebaudengoi]